MPPDKTLFRVLVGDKESASLVYKLLVDRWGLVDSQRSIAHVRAM